MEFEEKTEKSVVITIFIAFHGFLGNGTERGTGLKYGTDFTGKYKKTVNFIKK